MRVLQVVDSLAGGGAETSLAELAPALVNMGVELHVAYFIDRTDVADRLTSAGATLWPLLESRSRAARVFAIRRLAKRLRPDVVHTTLFEADMAGRVGARLAGVPVISSLVNEMYGPTQSGASANRLKLKLAQMLDIVTARFVRRFHAIGHAVATVMQRRLILRPSHVVVIPRGRDLDRLGVWSLERRENVRRAIGVAQDVPMILAVAREEPQKGLDNLIRAVGPLRRETPTLVVYIAGRRGTSSELLDQLVADLGLAGTVARLGHRSDTADLMVAADLLAFPSRWEGMGGTLIEALALECPIVCSDLDVLRETVGPDSHVAFARVDDIGSLVGALGATLHADRDSNRLAAGRQMALDTYSVVDVAASMFHLYEECSKRSGVSDRRVDVR